MSEKKLTLIEKIAGVRGMAEIVSKDKKGYGYSYADIVEILAKITAGMKKFKLVLIPEIVPGTTKVEMMTFVKTKVDKTGKINEEKGREMVVSGEMKFTWIDAENPDDRLEVPWFITGAQDDPSQAFGSGLTYCTRYFLTTFFQIAQDNDVDGYRSKQKAAEDSEKNTILSEMITGIDTLVREYLEENKDKAPEVRDFMVKYSKGGNYKAIKDITVATNLINEFKNKFLPTKETTTNISIEEKGE